MLSNQQGLIIEADVEEKCSKNGWRVEAKLRPKAEDF